MQIPTECPSCGSNNLELVKDLLYCRNDSCEAQSSGKLIKFCKTLKIKGFGPATLTKAELVEIKDLINLDETYLKTKGFSDTMAVKLTKAVNDRLESGVTFSDFLTAMSIPNIGSGTARKLGHLSVDELTLKECKNAGLGDVAANSILTWVALEWPKVKDLDIEISKSESVKKEVSNGKVVCMTGKLNDFSSRGKAKEYLTQLGYDVKDSVTKAVQYLICEDGKETSSSYKKAIAMGIPITTIKHLLEE